MKRRLIIVSFIIVLALTVSACGGLRYCQVTPDAESFHPRTIGVLPVDVGPHGEAAGVADRIFAKVLTETKWFDTVVPPEKVIGEMKDNKELQDAVVNYLTKLRTVSFSDPDLSKQIGDEYNIDAFLVVKVDFWDYTVEGEDKVAKVGFDIKLVDAETGKIICNAGHHEVEDYWMIKPDLADVAETVATEIINYMPH